MVLVLLPEGLRVLSDGSWQVGEAPIQHPLALRWLKSRLTFDDQGAYVVDGDRRLSVEVEGPAFEVTSLDLDPASGTALARLDDGSEEPLRDGSVGMDPATGRFVCAVRAGRARAWLSRAAHAQLLEQAEQTERGFVLRVGPRAFELRT
jgi:hypothetical protein